MKPLHRSLLILGYTLAAGSLAAQPDARPDRDGPPPWHGAHQPGRGQGPGGIDKPDGPHGPGDRPPGGPGRELQRRLREKFDTDKDGKLNPEEAKLARLEFRRIDEDRRARMLAKFDANKNGTLDEDEIAVMRKAWTSQLDEAKDDARRKFDTNGDGTVDDAEKAAAETAMREKWQKRRAEILKRFDTDGDGKLSDQEKEAARKEMPHRGGPPHEKPGQNVKENPESRVLPGQNPSPRP